MVKVRLVNFTDMQNAKAGLIRDDQIRTVEIEALVDTGAISLALPEDVVLALGAPVIRQERVRVADGRSLVVACVGGLLIEVLGRSAGADAYVLPVGATPLLGAVQLEMLDLVVVPSTRELIPNPAHPDGPSLPLLRAS